MTHTLGDTSRGMDPSEESFGQSEGSLGADYSDSFAHHEETRTPEASIEPRQLPALYRSMFQAELGRPLADPAAVETETVEKFKAIMAARAHERTLQHDSYKAVPQFYFRKV